LTKNWLVNGVVYVLYGDNNNC